VTTKRERLPANGLRLYTCAACGKRFVMFTNVGDKLVCPDPGCHGCATNGWVVVEMKLTPETP
jgi:hypothetical protein